jgi:hypothetical protein
MYGYHTSDGASEPIIGDAVRFTYTMAGGSSYAWREFTPTVTFATPGDFSVTYTTAKGRYWREGQTIKFRINITFTPTFTTASGAIRISGLPYASRAASYGSAFYPVTVHSSDVRYTWGTSATQLTGRVISGLSYLQLYGMGSGISTTTIGAAEFTSGQVTTIYLSGEYEAAA